MLWPLTTKFFSTVKVSASLKNKQSAMRSS